MVWGGRGEGGSGWGGGSNLGNQALGWEVAWQTRELGNKGTWLTYEIYSLNEIENRKNGGAIIKSLSILEEYLWECILLRKFQRILAT